MSSMVPNLKLPGTHTDTVDQGIKVVVRVRPMTEEELAQDPAPIIAPRGAQEVVLLDASKGYREKDVFRFDKTLWSIGQNPASQEDVYMAIGAAGVNHAMSGYNVCIMAYGQTGSGKTYTMVGPEGGHHGRVSGIIPRLAKDLFQRRSLMLHEAAEKDVKISMHCFEIYNEQVRDLLGGAQGQRNGNDFVKLRVRQHPIYGPYVEKLTNYEVTDAETFVQLLQQAANFRQTASTKSNNTSSRSHAIFALRVSQTEAVEDSDQTQMDSAVTTSTINLVDLAGSERIAKTGATGDRLTEAAHINQSLTVLRKVIDALVDKTEGKAVPGAVVPYRESMLTWLLSESIGGNSLTSVVATVSACNVHFEETQSTLRYALRTRGIINVAKKNESRTAMMIRELREEVENLRKEILRKDGKPLTSREIISPRDPYADAPLQQLTRRQRRMTCPPVMSEAQHTIQDTMDAVRDILGLAQPVEARAVDKLVQKEGRKLKCLSGQWDKTPDPSPRPGEGASQENGARQVRFHVNPTNGIATSPKSPEPTPIPAPLPTPIESSIVLKKRVSELEALCADTNRQLEAATDREKLLNKQLSEKVSSPQQFSRSHDQTQEFIRQALSAQESSHSKQMVSQAETYQKSLDELQARNNELQRHLSTYETHNSQVAYDEFRIDWVMPLLPVSVAQKLREQAQIMSNTIHENNSLVATLVKRLEGRDVELTNLRREVMELRGSQHMPPGQKHDKSDKTAPDSPRKSAMKPHEHEGQDFPHTRDAGTRNKK